MPRPWIEAGALLASAGRVPTEPPATPSIWSLHAMQPAPFAFLTRIDAVTLPSVYRDLNHLADHIERLRRNQPIQLKEVEDLHHRWRAAGGGDGVDAPEAPDMGVQVFTLLPDGSEDRCLGWAWLNGGGEPVLRAAMERAGRRAEERARRRPRIGLNAIADSSPLRSRLARAAILGAV